MKVIGLYGYYDQANYGDDLMAVMTAVYLKKNGYDCLVYGLRQDDKDDFKITTTNDLNELIRRSDAIVLAGGGLYISHRGPWIPVVEAYNQLGLLLESVKGQNKPIFGLSMGGSGRVSFPEWQSSAITFTRQARWISVRNKADLLIGETYQRCMTYHPDIVWCCSRFFPQHTCLKNSIRTTRIGIYGVYSGNRLDDAILFMLLRRLSRLKNIELIVINDSRVLKKLSAFNKSGGNIAFYKMKSLLEDTRLISTLDYVITSRLHVGISCMSYGGGMIGLLPEQKATLALTDIFLSENCITTRAGLIRILIRALLAKRADYILNRFSLVFPEVRDSMAKGAMLHFSDLLEQLSMCFK